MDAAALEEDAGRASPVAVQLPGAQGRFRWLSRRRRRRVETQLRQLLGAALSEFLATRRDDLVRPGVGQVRWSGGVSGVVSARVRSSPGSTSGRWWRVGGGLGAGSFRARLDQRGWAESDRWQAGHMPNRLARATSPYLLQHADNPVDWWELGRKPSKGPGAVTSRSC